MARATHENNVKVYFLTTLASQTSPSAAAIVAGRNLTPLITKDGVALNMSENMVDNASIDTAFDSQSIGSYGASLSITMFRDTDAATDPLGSATPALTRGTTGFIVRSPFGVPAATSKVDVFPVQVGVTQFANSAANENQKVTINFAVTAAPNLNVAAAA